MREIYRVIVAALIFSKDGKLLMGKKDPAKGGVYPNCWHMPGGGVEIGETLESALAREVLEETGMDISEYSMIRVPFINTGISEKTLKDGERVLCKMEFNRFEIHISEKDSTEINIHPTDELVELQWCTREQLKNIQQIPGGKEFFEKAGYIDATK